MEAFSLLRYWRSNGGGGDATTNADVTTSTVTTTAIVTEASSQTSETENEDDDNDHGPFFDLEFSLPAEGDKGAEDELVKNGENNVDCCEEDEDEDSDGSDESELKFTLMTDSSGDSTADVNVSVSPSDDLFFKGGFVPVDETTEIDSKPVQLQLQSRVSLMKSATKFRVMMLKFKKLKSNTESSEITESNASNCSNSKESEDSGKSTTEDLPIVSLFKRHNSSKAQKKRQNDVESVSASSEEKKFSKEAMQRYLRKVKPLYVRVSKRYGEKLKFSGQFTKLNLTPSPSPATEEQKPSPAVNPNRENESTSEVSVSEPPLLLSNIKALKQGNLPAGLRVVCKHLRKSRSAFTAVAAAPPGAISSNRRDDSLLQQQDGIQSAILHCKKSFKASRESDCSSSDPAPTYSKCENSYSCDENEADEINKR